MRLPMLRVGLRWRRRMTTPVVGVARVPAPGAVAPARPTVRQPRRQTNERNWSMFDRNTAEYRQDTAPTVRFATARVAVGDRDRDDTFEIPVGWIAGVS